MRRRKDKIQVRFFVFVLICMMFITGMPVYAAKANTTEKVRVGYFQFDGYHNIDENGIKSGYGYDFLQLLAGYANFEYEYVGYDKSWDDMLQMLEDGEIDMLTFARYTDERSKKFAYSNNPIGYSSVILSTTKEQTKIKQGNYATYEGIKIGVIKGSTQEKQMEEFAQEHGFSYETVYYENLEELKNALQKTKEIDAIVSSSIRTLSNECVLERFDESPIYVIVRKDDTKLLSEINRAMDMLDTYNPTWKTTLSEEYYSASQVELAINEEEMDYLEQLKEEGGTLRVLVNPDLKPYSYFEDNQAKGILVDYFNEIMALYDLKASYIQVDTAEEYYKAAIDKEADVVLAPHVGYYEADTSGYYLSNTILKAPVSIVVQRGKKKISKDDKIAVTKGMTSIVQTEFYNYGDTEIVYYNSVQECVDAVKNKKVDGAVLYTFSAYNISESDWSNDLQILDVSYNPVEFHIAIPMERDRNLYVLINSAINTVDDAKVQAMIAQNTLSAQNKSDPVWVYIYRHPALLLCIIGFIVLMIVMMLLIYNRSTKIEQTQKRKRAEFAAAHDALTGALNRSVYNKMINTKNEMTKRVGIMILDVDYFKAVNDNYGHDIGDRVLKQTASML